MRHKVFKTRYFMMDCSQCYVIYRRIPHIRCQNYDPRWGLYGFTVVWLGWECMFCFGEDRKGLYTEKAR